MKHDAMLTGPSHQGGPTTLILIDPDRESLDAFLGSAAPFFTDTSSRASFLATSTPDTLSAARCVAALGRLLRIRAGRLHARQFHVIALAAGAADDVHGGRALFDRLHQHSLPLAVAMAVHGDPAGAGRNVGSFEEKQGDG